MDAETLSQSVIARDREALAEIVREECQLAMWQRDLAFEPAPLMEGPVDEIRLESTAGNVAVDMKLAMANAGYAASSAREALTRDIADLTAQFSEIAGCTDIALRLAMVETDSCRKFHADWITLRLISTYVGRGTEWLESRDAKRVADGNEPLAINCLNVGDVGIFKGRLASEQPAIHRSPPISGIGEKRLLLVLDPAK
ncbi:DUF1826 domain-containing protein [Qipengyuania flava]|nr:DUF1826 domain-containing protein [Qipengyuania flava]